MCNPVGVALGAVGAVGQLSQGSANRDEARALAEESLIQSEVAAGNAELGRITARAQKELARLPRIAAGVEQRQIAGEVAATVGSQTAIFAALGIDPSHGAPLLLHGLTVAQGETDAALVRAGAEVERAGQLATEASTYADVATQQVAAEVYAKRAKNLKKRGQQLATAGVFGAATSFLTGVNSAGGFQL